MIILTLSLSLSGCNKTYTWEFRKPSSEVKQISIIYIETHLHNEKDIINLPPIAEIDKLYADTLYEEITNLCMKERFLSMERAFPYGYCFLIDYGNDDYCILSAKGSGYIYYHEKYKVLTNESTNYIFNEEEFSALIDKYLNNKDS